MNKFFLFVATTASAECQAATGSARDGELASLLIVALLVMPVAGVYVIRFVKNRISDINRSKLLKKHSIDHNGDI